MKIRRRQFLQFAAATFAVAPPAQIAWSQTYPNRPVRLIVGFAPGGATDIAARLIGQWLSERLGQQFVIENKPGSRSQIGPQGGGKAPPARYNTPLARSPTAV